MKLLSEETNSNQIVDFEPSKNLELEKDRDEMRLLFGIVWVVVVSWGQRSWWDSWVQVQKVHQVLEDEIYRQDPLCLNHQIRLFLDIRKSDEVCKVN